MKLKLSEKDVCAVLNPLEDESASEQAQMAVPTIRVFRANMVHMGQILALNFSWKSLRLLHRVKLFLLPPESHHNLSSWSLLFEQVNVAVPIIRVLSGLIERLTGAQVNPLSR